MSASVRKKSARPVQIRVFLCPECGTKVSATKTKAKTKAGHIKTMYCYVCKKYTDHVQVD